MKTAFTYHRYSTENQRDGYSIEVQRNITKKIAEKHECNITAVYEDEAISGSTIEKRPQMLALLEDIKTVKPNYIICVDQDRISRGNEFWYIKSLMAKYNVSLVTEKEGIINFKEDISQDFMSDILASAAKYERGMIRQRIKRAMIERSSKGLAVGNLTHTLGYDYKNGTLVINTGEAQIVKTIFDMCKKGLGPLAIARRLNKSGISTKKGLYFVGKNVKYILRNPLYCGYVRHYEGTFKSSYEPIIDEVTFYSCQKNLDKMSRIIKTKPSKYLLTGFLKCESCGHNLGGCFKNLQDGKIYSTYRCIGYHRGVCTAPVFIEKDKVENYIIDEVTKKLKDLKLPLIKSIANIKNKLNNSNAEIAKRKYLLGSKLDKLLNEYLEGFLDKNKYRKLVYNINKEMSTLKDNNGNIDLSFLSEIDIEETFLNAEMDEKRRLLIFVLDKVIVYRQSGNRYIKNRVKIFWNEIG